MTAPTPTERRMCPGEILLAVAYGLYALWWMRCLGTPRAFRFGR